MTRVKIIGIRDCDFTSDDGAHVRGMKVYASFDEFGVQGQMTDSFWLGSGTKWPELRPGMTADFDFNRKGRLASVTIVSGSTGGKF